jgi:DNA-binding NarL/FixJ family response regulator
VQLFQHGLDALRAMQSWVPDLLVAGVRISDMDGLEHLEPFMGRELSVLIVTSCKDERSFALMRAVRYDAIYDTAAEDMKNFDTALDRALKHHLYVSPTLVPLLNPPEDVVGARLTATEQRVLSIIGEGADDGEAAGRLGLSKFTINTHRKSIMEKLNVHHKGALMRYALHKGYVHFTPERVYRPGFQRLIDGLTGNEHGPAYA